MAGKNEVRLLALNDAGKENVLAVSKLLMKQHVKSIWVDLNDVLSTTHYEEDVIYVVDPTQGKEVDYLVELGFSVIGPQCALTVLKHNILLKKDLQYPVYNLTMLGCLICFSNIEPSKRATLRSKVERMGGKVTGILTENVTHLVVKEVGSVKYFSAAHAGIALMTLDWIEHLWKHGQSRYISAKDGKWEEFRCPIFLGCSVCVTGFSTSERNRIQKLVTKFGGIYSGAMKLDFTTHLVVHKPEGQKYAMANRFGVKVVGVEWIYKSVEKGSCQDHVKFPVQASASAVSKKPNSSTPERNDTKMPHLHDMSNISVMTVNETVAPSMTDVSTLSTIHVQQPTNKTSKADLLNFPLLSCSEQILDGISVYTTGFSIKEEERLHQILIKCGATKCKQLTAVVSHVLVGSVLSDNLALIQDALTQCENELWIVSYKWLLDSLSRGEILSEFDYWMDSIAPKPNHAEESSNPQQSTYIQGESTAKETSNNSPNSSSRCKVPSGSPSHSGVPPNSPPHHDVPAMHDVLSQYMDGDTTLLRNFDIEEVGEDTGNVGEPIKHHESSEQGALSGSRWFFFRGLSFILVGFEEEEHSQCMGYIESLGGSLLPSYSKKVADYAVVPVIGFPLDRTAKHIVTDFWLDSCLADGKLLQPNFHPMSSPFLLRDVAPLETCVTSLSKYQEPERRHLVALMTELGAIYQDNVARKDMPPLRRTTHLVVLTPEGDKYVGCKKWKIPTVTAEWVFECARRGEKVAEAEFLVDKANNVKETTDIEAVDLHQEDNKLLKKEGMDVDEQTSPPHPFELPPIPQLELPQAPQCEFPPMPRPPSKVDDVRRRLEARQKCEKLQAASTPFKDKVLRMMDTPSKFLRPDVDVSFHLDEVFALLKTPAHEQKMMKATLTPDTPLSDCVARFLKDSLKNVQNISDDLAMNLEKLFDVPDEGQSEVEIQGNQDCAEATSRTNADTAESCATADVAKPLKGVVVYVPKKLLKLRMDVNHVCNLLGGEFRWCYDAACTHFIFQGKLNDVNREYRTARSQGKFIVSPHWLEACKEAGTRLDEAEFPHIYNPNKSIQIVPVASQTRAKRATRSSTQSSQVAARVKRFNASTSLSENDEKRSKKPQKAKENAETVRASQRARESLRKTLESIMSSTEKIKSAPTRLNCDRNSSYSSPNNPPLPPKTGKLQAHFKMTSDSEKPESSQDVHVMWDDPISRQEMEKIMREQSGIRSHHELGNERAEDNVNEDDDSKKTTNSEDAPEEGDNRLSQIIREGRIPTFLISSVSPEQKIEYATIVEHLGGTYLNRDYFDPLTTHLIVKKPARNEKYLASLASGKWILHTSYMEACKEAGVFVKEDAFEYGNPLNAWIPSNEAESALSFAAYRWRRKLLKRCKSDESVGSFAGWNVLLFTSPRHTPGFIRLLQSGSGRVVGRSIPFQGDVSALTHAIIDPTRCKEIGTDQIESLHEAGVHCCVPEYLAEYLMKDPLPNVEDSYLPVVKQYIENHGSKPKRRKTTAS